MGRAILVLVLMILCHLIADYPLQGWLAQAKHKKYWEQQAEMYQHDYIPALVCHATMWSIMIFTPIMWASYNELNWLWIMLPVNIFIHYFIDNLKANELKINLIADQLIHLVQIIATWLVWLLILGV